jgi:hypothetical protein
MDDKNWRDITSYRKGEVDRVPRTLELKKLSPFNTSLTISRHIYYPDTWLVSCNGTSIDNINLHTNDIEEAKRLGIEYMIKYANDMLDKWNNVINALNEKE